MNRSPQIVIQTDGQVATKKYSCNDNERAVNGNMQPAARQLFTLRWQSAHTSLQLWTGKWNLNQGWLLAFYSQIQGHETWKRRLMYCDNTQRASFRGNALFFKLRSFSRAEPANTIVQILWPTLQCAAQIRTPSAVTLTYFTKSGKPPTPSALPHRPTLQCAAKTPTPSALLYSPTLQWEAKPQHLVQDNARPKP